jgi:hypothetical protein
LISTEGKTFTFRQTMEIAVYGKQQLQNINGTGWVMMKNQRQKMGMHCL